MAAIDRRDGERRRAADARAPHLQRAVPQRAKILAMGLTSPPAVRLAAPS